MGVVFLVYVIDLIKFVTYTFNLWRFEMKSYDELKAEMEAIQQQMFEARRNERAHEHSK